MSNPDAVQVLDVIFNWYQEGRKMPGYVRGNGYPYLYMLLGLMAKHPSLDEYVTAYERCERRSPGIHAKLLGPNGWTFMQVLIIRANLKEGVNG